jgi:hypothetical protein
MQPSSSDSTLPNARLKMPVPGWDRHDPLPAADTAGRQYRPQQQHRQVHPARTFHLVVGIVAFLAFVLWSDQSMAGLGP